MLKRIALAAVAAAGMVCAAQAAAPAVFNWSGQYIGGHAGYGFGSYHHRNDNNGGRTRDFDMNGIVGGITAGYNWQTRGSAFVFGLETDFSFSGVKGGDDDPAWGCGGLPCTASVKWFGTVRPRAGIAVNNALFFVTGGWAFGNVEATSGSMGGTVEGSSEFQSGWTVGAGMEWAFSPRWSAKVEYLHVDLGDFVYKFSGATPISVQNLQFDVVRLGVNYRW
jgi:outer membrane immunogenic protein